MKKFKFDNEKKMCLEIGQKNGRTVWKKYKPYAMANYQLVLASFTMKKKI